LQNERRIILVKFDLHKMSVKDLINLLDNGVPDNEQRYQILVELQQRNAGTRCKEFCKQ